MRVLITGGSGYLGSWLIFRLGGDLGVLTEETRRKAKESFKIFYTYNSTPIPQSAFYAHGIEEPQAIQLNITDRDAVAVAVASVRPDVVVHLAAWVRTRECEDDPAKAYEVHVKGTENLISALEGTTTRFIYLSTSWVYSPSNILPITEDYICSGVGVYGKTKYLGEQCVRASNLPYVILRTDIIYGPPAPFSGLVSFSQFITDGLCEGKSLMLYEDEIKTPAYVKDVTECIFLVIKNTKIWITREVLNVGSPSSLSTYQLGLIFCDALHRDKNSIKAVTRSDALLHKRPTNTSLSIKKMERILNFQGRDIVEGVKDTLSEKFPKKSQQNYRWSSKNSKDQHFSNKGGGEIRRNFPKRILVSTYIFGSVLSSTVLILLIKHLASKFNFSYMMSLTCAHFACQWIAWYVFNRMGYVDHVQLPRHETWRLSISLMGSIVFMNFSVQFNSIGFYQTTKLLVIPVIIFLQYFLYRDTISPAICLALLMTVAGAGIVTITDMELHMLGFSIGVVAILFTSLFQIWCNHTQKTWKVDAKHVLCCISSQVFLLSLISSLLLELPGNSILGIHPMWDYHFAVEELLLIFSSGLVAIFANFFTFALLGQTSPITYQVVGHAKTCLLIGCGWLLFPFKAPSRDFIYNLFGLFTAILGSVLYGMQSIAERRKFTIAPLRTVLTTIEVAARYMRFFFSNTSIYSAKRLLCISTQLLVGIWVYRYMNLEVARVGYASLEKITGKNFKDMSTLSKLQPLMEESRVCRAVGNELEFRPHASISEMLSQSYRTKPLNSCLLRNAVVKNGVVFASELHSSGCEQTCTSDLPGNISCTPVSRRNSFNQPKKNVRCDISIKRGIIIPLNNWHIKCCGFSNIYHVIHDAIAPLFDTVQRHNGGKFDSGLQAFVLHDKNDSISRKYFSINLDSSQIRKGLAWQFFEMVDRMFDKPVLFSWELGLDDKVVCFDEAIHGVEVRVNWQSWGQRAENWRSDGKAMMDLLGRSWWHELYSNISEFLKVRFDLRKTTVNDDKDILVYVHRETEGAIRRKRVTERTTDRKARSIAQSLAKKHNLRFLAIDLNFLSVMDAVKIAFRTKLMVGPIGSAMAFQTFMEAPAAIVALKPCCENWYAASSALHRQMYTDVWYTPMSPGNISLADVKKIIESCAPPYYVFTDDQELNYKEAIERSIQFIKGNPDSQGPILSAQDHMPSITYWYNATSLVENEKYIKVKQKELQQKCKGKGRSCQWLKKSVGTMSAPEAFTI